jgi:hypothetical protein
MQDLYRREEMEEALARAVVDGAYWVHTNLGPGPLEAVHERCFSSKLKGVEAMEPVFLARILTQLKLVDLHLGFLFNFNVARIEEGNQLVSRQLKLEILNGAFEVHWP